MKMIEPLSLTELQENQQGLEELSYFAWNDAKARNSNDTDLGSKESEPFEPSIPYKEDICM